MIKPVPLIYFPCHRSRGVLMRSATRTSLCGLLRLVKATGSLDITLSQLTRILKITSPN